MTALRIGRQKPERMNKLTTTLTTAWSALRAHKAGPPAFLKTGPARRALRVLAFLVIATWHQQDARTAAAGTRAAASRSAAAFDPGAFALAVELDEIEAARASGFKDDVTRYRIYEASDVVVPDHVPDRHVAYMLRAAKSHHIPTSIMFRLIRAESEFKPTARSSAGARGYMQLMPGTRRELLHAYRIDTGTMADYKVNIELGARYLEELHGQALKVVPQERKAWRLALAYYNAGPEKVIGNGNRVPSYCRAYVNAISRSKP